LLSFIFRNIVFSKGYERKNKKIFLRFEFAAGCGRQPRNLFSPRLREVIIAEHHNAAFRFCQQNAEVAEARLRSEMRGRTAGLPTRSAWRRRRFNRISTHKGAPACRIHCLTFRAPAPRNTSLAWRVDRSLSSVRQAHAGRSGEAGGIRVGNRPFIAPSCGRTGEARNRVNARSSHKFSDPR
jgi:hypothetical protein